MQNKTYADSQSRCADVQSISMLCSGTNGEKNMRLRRGVDSWLESRGKSKSKSKTYSP
jgi:hypothetical protein